MNIGHLSGRLATPAKERGVVLFIALIVLVVMSLIGISMIRQGSSSQMVAGNLAFKEGAEAAADLGMERARDWLVLRTGADLEKDFATNGTKTYVSNGLSVVFDPFILSDADWDPYKVPAKDLSNSDDPVIALKRQEYSVFYVIHRLCDKTGSITANNNLCILHIETSSTEGIDYGNAAVAGFMPYYRVTVRVRGPRNTTSYVQALLY